jgi:hypothetical protein
MRLPHNEKALRAKCGAQGFAVKRRSAHYFLAAFFAGAAAAFLAGAAAFAGALAAAAAGFLAGAAAFAGAFAAAAGFLAGAFMALILISARSCVPVSLEPA